MDKATLWNLADVPGWKLDCMLERAYYERSELAESMIKEELKRRQTQREQDCKVGSAL